MGLTRRTLSSSGANLQVVRRSPDAVSLDVLPIDAAVRTARFVPSAGRERLEDPFSL